MLFIPRRKLLIASLYESASVRGDTTIRIEYIRRLNSTFGTRSFLYWTRDVIAAVGGRGWTSDNMQ